MGFRNSPSERETPKGQFNGIDSNWENGPDEDLQYGYYIEVLETDRHITPYQYMLQNKERVAHLQEYLENTGGKIISIHKVLMRDTDHGSVTISREEITLFDVLTGGNEEDLSKSANCSPSQSLDSKDTKESGHEAGPEQPQSENVKEDADGI